MRFGYVTVDGGYGKGSSWIKHGGVSAGQARNWRKCKYKRSATSLNAVSVKSKANAAWPVIKRVYGVPGITIWRRPGKKCRGAANGQCYPSMTW